MRLRVSDLVDKPGERRVEEGSVDVDVAVGESRVAGPVEVRATIEGIDDGVLVRFVARAPARLACTRCLEELDEVIEVDGIQLYEPEPDEDGYALETGDVIDLGGPVRDEVSLSIPIRPLCRPACAGLCPTCGTDLNEDPCDGHDEVSSSPFAALQGLFDDPDR